jgi:hypothetical protein
MAAAAAAAAAASSSRFTFSTLVRASESRELDAVRMSAYTQRGYSPGGLFLPAVLLDPRATSIFAWRTSLRICRLLTGGLRYGTRRRH